MKQLLKICLSVFFSIAVIFLADCQPIILKDIPEPYTIPYGDIVYVEDKYGRCSQGEVLKITGGYGDEIPRKYECAKRPGTRVAPYDSFSIVRPTLILSAYATGKNYFFPKDAVTLLEGTKFLINDPREKIVILYTPGAASNNRPEPCRYAASTPSILLSLWGEVIDGKEVVIHGFCSLVVGNLGAGLSMSEARAPELENMVRTYQAQGVPANQIFVAGHSMGGWAAVLVGARQKVDIAGFIAFAPANGIWKKDKRGPHHYAAVDRQRTAVEGLKRLDGLLFLFEGDPFNSPSDLAYMKEIPGIKFYGLSPCSDRSPHMMMAEYCFQSKFKRVVATYIENQVTGMAVSKK